MVPRGWPSKISNCTFVSTALDCICVETSAEFAERFLVPGPGPWAAISIKHCAVRHIVNAHLLTNTILKLFYHESIDMISEVNAANEERKKEPSTTTNTFYMLEKNFRKTNTRNNMKNTCITIFFFTMTRSTFAHYFLITRTKPRSEREIELFFETNVHYGSNDTRVLICTRRINWFRRSTRHASVQRNYTGRRRIPKTSFNTKHS